MGGVPIFERFFLGDEFTIRGYNVRSISPIAPVDTFITSQGVVFAENSVGDPIEIPGLQNAASLGVFTGSGGSQQSRRCHDHSLPSAAIRRLLGNFEYRIPIIGDTVSLAGFADIGTAFNLRTKTDQPSRAHSFPTSHSCRPSVCCRVRGLTVQSRFL